jgi:peptidoglycan hydrolase-like protein with peptidoglycan-binding domain
MNALLNRTRRLPHAIAADLATAAVQLDADAERFKAHVDEVRGDLAHAATLLDADVDRLTARLTPLVTAVAATLVAAFDGLVAKVDALHPGLFRPARALRLARTLAASTAVLSLISGLALATMAGPHAKVRLDRLADGQAPARLQALANEQPLGEGNEGAGAAGPAVAAATAPAARTIPANKGALPVGKGMWIWQPERTEGNNAAAIVSRAKTTGLTHLYVRTGTLKEGFVGAEFLNRLLPAAHAAGIRVFAWDFPYLNDWQGDVNRALAAINYTTPDGHRVDGYSADIELRSMGVNITPQTAWAFGAALRKGVGPNYPLIATVPRPSPRLVSYPFAEVTAHFDAIAPMVYWMANEPASTVTDAIAQLARFGKPVIPVGQAYDAAAEGGPAGVPPRDQILAFMKAADQAGAISVSWWSWQHADQQAWDAVRDAAEFQLPTAAAGVLTAGQVRAYQGLLRSMGYAAPVTGVWDAETAKAMAEYQRAARLPVTGVVDVQTRETLLTPFPPPIHPQP